MSDWCAVGVQRRSVPPLRKRPQEERQVGWTLGKAADEVAVPLRTERHIDPDVVASVGQPALLAVADAVQHLVLEIVYPAPILTSQRRHDSVTSSPSR